MIAAYVGQLAPSGRIAVCALFQAADEVRRIQRVSYRMALAERAHPGSTGNPLSAWQNDPSWQPLRSVIERGLVAWDFGEAFTAVNLCVKPLLDELLYDGLARRQAELGDAAWASICRSLQKDSQWQRTWSRALLAMLLNQRPDNRSVLQGWLDVWWPMATSATMALAAAWGVGDSGAPSGWRSTLGALGLSTPAPSPSPPS
jgi:toluene monooxygenase system protein E